ncbi:hypothetical protein QE422_001576 [Chryseobacterium sp. SORGH_AS 447]|uniref:hypothetical protein n=1 Tax=Chryseobacterium sp. SORGH_AS_0447 TaxID=3041769 RepID=UPI0027896F95|nr:hypothetical protein [Chryseobacterium sp. SORGH_AS_0447]MDQ1161208.1 hypothetical protein [Chryseobacterium sp. SORGH_AS_0447]
MKKAVILLSFLAVVACKKNPEKFVNDKADSTKPAQTGNRQQTSVSVDKETALKAANEGVLQALKDKNYKRFADFIHPEKGVRFSMYAFVSPEGDKLFSKSDFIKYQPTKTIFTWGALDGSGDLYKSTITDYLIKWVYSKDFATGQVSINEFQGKGNSMNNLKEIYPKADFTENFVKGSESNPEMDWKCLRLVFEQYQGKYYLIGVVNDQWTI